MAMSRGRRTHSRRWFLGALGASAGAVGLAALGCSDDDEPQPAGDDPTPEPTAGEYPTYSSTPAPDPTRADQAGRHGGALRFATAFSSNGRFDPHTSISSSLLGQLSLIYSRLLTYEDQVEGRLAPDLASGLPEQPDDLTYVFHLNPDARWHDIEPLNGRLVTAQDVLASIERQRQGDASFPRKGRWEAVSSLEALDDRTLVVRLETPFAGMLSRFASPEGFVLPTELAGLFSPGFQVGSGPFRWIEWSEGSFASVARNDAWHGPTQGPFLDGISTVPPRSIDELEADFRTKELDAVEAGFRQAQELKRRLPDLREARTAVAQFYGMRFLSVFPPFDDPRLRSALTVAIDRREMLERFFHGSGTLNPWISAAVERWSLPQAELQQIAGYRPGDGGRAIDVREARDALAAYQAEQEDAEEGEEAEPLELLVTRNVEQGLGIGTLIREQIQSSLGLDISVQALTIEEMSARLLAGEAPWAVGVDNGWIELDDWLYPYFSSEGSSNTFVLRDETMDALIDEQRTELSPGRRQAIAYEAQRRLLELNVGANFVSEDVLTLFQPYVQLFPVDAGEAYQDRFSKTWIDRTHPTYLP